VGRGVQLPKFANAGALPTADGGQNSFSREGVSQLIGDGPVAHLGTVEFKGVKPERLRSGKAVGAWWRAGQTFAQEVQDWLGPRSGVVAA